MEYLSHIRVFMDILSITTSCLYIWSISVASRNNRNLYHNVEYAFGHPIDSDESDSDYEYESETSSDSDCQFSSDSDSESSSDSDSDSDNESSSDTDTQSGESSSESGSNSDMSLESVESVDGSEVSESEGHDSGFEDNEEKPLLDTDTKVGILMHSSGMWGDALSRPIAPLGSIYSIGVEPLDDVPELVEM